MKYLQNWQRRLKHNLNLKQSSFYFNKNYFFFTLIITKIVPISAIAIPDMRYIGGFDSICNMKIPTVIIARYNSIFVSNSSTI